MIVSRITTIKETTGYDYPKPTKTFTLPTKSQPIVTTRPVITTKTTEKIITTQAPTYLPPVGVLSCPPGSKDPRCAAAAARSTFK